MDVLMYDMRLSGVLKPGDGDTEEDPSTNLNFFCMFENLYNENKNW